MAASSTDLADINEILLAFYLNGKTWKGISSEAKSQLELKKKKATAEQYYDQERKAEEMSKEVIKWAKSNKYSGKIKQVWWTARPGVLSEAVKQEVDSRKNPTDVLVLFSDKKFLGVSAKSTKGSWDIGFKNPGLGTIDSAVGMNLKAIADKETDAFVKKYKLSSSSSTRKSEIKKSKSLENIAQERGFKLLNTLIKEMYKKLNSKPQEFKRKFILENWMDSSKGIFPPYIKVTGMGSKEPYTAKVENPLQNSKLYAIMKENIKLQLVGNDSIAVLAGTKRIMKMRIKYESQKLASSIKFSGDPY